MNVLTFVKSMKHSPIHNYGGIPGLTSWLIGGPSKRGIVRLMECSRDHQEPIIPHSHRFDFHCLVLAGSVRNIIWSRHDKGDAFQQTTLRYDGEPGDYCKGATDLGRWTTTTREYPAGGEYSMHADQVHSIFFARNTSVLFFEGPTVSSTSIILEPVVGNEVIPTFEVRDWMFKRGMEPV